MRLVPFITTAKGQAYSQHVPLLTISLVTLEQAVDDKRFQHSDISPFNSPLENV